MRDTLFHEAMQFAETLTANVLENSRVYPGQSVAGYGPNATGGTLIRPGGRACYPSYWIRDFAMSLECGLISTAEIAPIDGTSPANHRLAYLFWQPCAARSHSRSYNV